MQGSLHVEWQYTAVLIIFEKKKRCCFFFPLRQQEDGQRREERREGVGTKEEDTNKGFLTPVKGHFDPLENPSKIGKVVKIVLSASSSLFS